MKNYYYDDFRICELRTVVKEVIEERGFYWTSFEITIFFLGDHYHDFGYINQCEVFNLKEVNGVLYHLINEKLEGEVHMAIDRGRRYIQAQNETLSLLMNDVMESVYHYKPIEHFVSDYFMVSRYKGKTLNYQQRNELQISLNGMIRDDYHVSISYDKIDNQRFVKIGLLKQVQSNEIYVPSLKFIQMANVLEIMPKENDEFIIITTCGDQMLFTLDRYHEIIKEASESLQCEPLFINTSIHHVLNKIKKMW